MTRAGSRNLPILRGRLERYCVRLIHRLDLDQRPTGTQQISKPLCHNLQFQDVLLRPRATILRQKSLLQRYQIHRDPRIKSPYWTQMSEIRRDWSDRVSFTSGLYSRKEILLCAVGVRASFNQSVECGNRWLVRHCDSDAPGTIRKPSCISYLHGQGNDSCGGSQYCKDAGQKRLILEDPSARRLFRQVPRTCPCRNHDKRQAGKCGSSCVDLKASTHSVHPSELTIRLLSSARAIHA